LKGEQVIFLSVSDDNRIKVIRELIETLLDNTMYYSKLRNNNVSAYWVKYVKTADDLHKPYYQRIYVQYIKGDAVPVFHVIFPVEWFPKLLPDTLENGDGSYSGDESSLDKEDSGESDLHASYIFFCQSLAVLLKSICPNIIIK